MSGIRFRTLSFSGPGVEDAVIHDVDEIERRNEELSRLAKIGRQVVDGPKGEAERRNQVWVPVREAVRAEYRELVAGGLNPTNAALAITASAAIRERISAVVRTVLEQNEEYFRRRPKTPWKSGASFYSFAGVRKITSS